MKVETADGQYVFEVLESCLLITVNWPDKRGYTRMTVPDNLCAAILSLMREVEHLRDNIDIDKTLARWEQRLRRD